jgi:hypothetical protein
MTTPFEQEVLDAFTDKLRSEGVSDEVVEGLVSAFQSEKLPTPDEIVSLVKSESGDKSI